MKQSLLSFAIFLASTVIAGAQQTMTLHQWSQPSAVGQVVGSSSKGESGVPVEIAGPKGKTYALTDENGKWYVYDLPAGTYTARPVVGQKAKQNQASFTIEETGTFQKWFGEGHKVNEVGTMRVEPDAPK